MMVCNFKLVAFFFTATVFSAFGNPPPPYWVYQGGSNPRWVPRWRIPYHHRPTFDEVKADVDKALHTPKPSWQFIEHLIQEVEEYLHPMSDIDAEMALMHLLGDSDEGDQILQEIVDEELDRHDRFLWQKEDGVVKIPYVIDDELEDKTDMLEKAMSQYNNLTCIRFVPRSDEEDYLLIEEGDSCLTEVGHKGGEQFMQLGTGCFYTGTLVHELGHVIGFYHEHQRPDRDKYITVNDDNVEEGKEHNFVKVWGRGENMITDFDMHSIMIYGQNAFSKDTKSLKTMEPHKGKDDITNPYDKPGLNDNDVARVKKLYRC